MITLGNLINEDEDRKNQIIHEQIFLSKHGRRNHDNNFN